MFEGPFTTSRFSSWCLKPRNPEGIEPNIIPKSEDRFIHLQHDFRKQQNCGNGFIETCQWIGGKIVTWNHIFSHQIYGFSCHFSIKPIHWYLMTGRLWTFETCQVILKELLKQPRPYGSANRKQGSPRRALDTGTTWTWEKCLGFPKFVAGFSTQMFVFFLGGYKCYESWTSSLSSTWFVHLARVSSGSFLGYDSFKI